MKSSLLIAALDGIAIVIAKKKRNCTWKAEKVMERHSPISGLTPAVSPMK